MSIIRTTKTKVEWTGRKYDLLHAIEFYRKGHWDLEFAANWLEVSVKDFLALATEDCSNCKGGGKVWREYAK